MNAYEIRALKDMGVEVGRLGCVMLDVEPVDVTLPADWAYVSSHPDRRWIHGVKPGNHITLLYGLLSNAHLIRSAVDEVLAGWEPGRLEVESIGSFPSSFPDEPYACIVTHIAVSDALADAHARLSLLPHIDTHPSYRPHLTLGYVHRGREGDAIALLADAQLHLVPGGLNYGWKPEQR